MGSNDDGGARAAMWQASGLTTPATYNREMSLVTEKGEEVWEIRGSYSDRSPAQGSLAPKGDAKRGAVFCQATTQQRLAQLYDVSTLFRTGTVLVHTIQYNTYLDVLFQCINYSLPMHSNGSVFQNTTGRLRQSDFRPRRSIAVQGARGAVPLSDWAPGRVPLSHPLVERNRTARPDGCHPRLPTTTLNGDLLCRLVLVDTRSINSCGRVRLLLPTSYLPAV